ncbi:MAG: cyclic nucleotide-binding domain-containing protein [Candidatus Sedimenticola sp. (ex Thyasira tokunagai)]
MAIKFEVIEITGGTVLFEKGDPGDCAYIVVSGGLEISTQDTGQKVVLGHVTPGELVGEMAIMESVPRNATATATEDTTLRLIQGNQLRDYLKTLDPDVQEVFELMASRRQDNLQSLLESRLMDDE